MRISRWLALAFVAACGDGGSSEAAVPDTKAPPIDVFVEPDTAALPIDVPVEPDIPEPTGCAIAGSDGTACGAGQFCLAGACEPGCWIDGALVPTGVDGCRECDPSRNATAWSPVADGAGCGAGKACSAGECTDGCVIGGVPVGPGAPNPFNPCQVCDNMTSTGAWTNAADGTVCNGAQVCTSGTCTTGCWIDGALVAVGMFDPTNPCRTCNPAASPTAYSPLPLLTACGANLYCDADAVCRSGCAVGDKFYEPDAYEFGNACKVCAPATSSFGFTTLADGAECPGGTCISANCEASPFVSLISPSCGSNLGGDVITISGEAFAPGAKVSVAGVASPSVVLSDPNSLAVTLPSVPGVTGLVPVSVSNAFGSPVVKDQDFRLFEGVAFRTTVNVPTAAPVASAVAGDFDDDGKDDLAYIQNGSVVVQRAGKLDASFGKSDSLTTCSGASTLATADVNGDGVVDLLVGCQSSIEFYRGNEGSAPTFLGATTTGGFVRLLKPGNFDLDGKVDIAFALSGATAVKVYRGNGNGTFTLATTVNTSGIVDTMAVGDVTGDGRDDIATGNYDDGSFSLHLASAQDTFGAPLTTEAAPLQTIDIGRIDGDAFADIVISSTDPDVSSSFYLSTGSGALSPRTALTDGGLIGAAIGDFNEDGLTDVLVNGGGGIRVFPGNGDGTYSCLIQLYVDPEPYYLTVGDFDGNGRLDVLGRNPNQNEFTFVMQNGP